MSLIKKIAICTGLDENNNNQPIWEVQEIGVKANNVLFTSNFLGQNNLNSMLNAFLPTQELTDFNCILALDENGKLYSTGISVGWLNDRYAEWAAQQEPEDTGENEEPQEPDPNNSEPEES